MILLDTHILIWWVDDEARLPDGVRKRINQSTEVALSPVSFWEIGNLVRAGRIRLADDPARWARRLLDRAGIVVAQLTPAAALAAGTMADFHSDPADRLIFSTARELRIPLVSKDQRIRDYAEANPGVEVVW